MLQLQIQTVARHFQKVKSLKNTTSSFNTLPRGLLSLDPCLSRTRLRLDCSGPKRLSGEEDYLVPKKSHQVPLQHVDFVFRVQCAIVPLYLIGYNLLHPLLLQLLHLFLSRLQINPHPSTFQYFSIHHRLTTTSTSSISSFQISTFGVNVEALPCL